MMPRSLLLLIAASGSATALAPLQHSRTAALLTTPAATGATPAQTNRRALLTTTATGAAALVLSPATASAGSKLEDGLALPEGARRVGSAEAAREGLAVEAMAVEPLPEVRLKV